MSGRAEIDGLLRELDRWADAGQTARFWWRDDDLQHPGDALDPLLEMADATEWCPGLAVIPDGADSAALIRRFGEIDVEVLIHGFAHRNHAVAGAKKCEFPANRPLEEMVREVANALSALRAGFPDHLRPVFVPPWNRIAPELVAALAGCGYRALSTYGPRLLRMPEEPLRRLNTHVDVIDWRGDRRFIGTGAVAEGFRAHLAVRREGRADRGEASGLLTHHLVMIEEDWRRIGALFHEIRAHRAARLCSPSEGVEC